MNRYWILTVLVVFGTGSFWAGRPVEAKTYGSGVKGEPTHTLAELKGEKAPAPGTFVRVKAKIHEVCPRTGCWMELEDVKTGDRIRVQVKEGAIEFPKTAAGKEAVVEGRLVAKHLSERRARRYFAHLAEDKGEKFDPSSITGPVTLYELEATGADIP